ncbi:hypothetical protein ACOMHN_036113 [Nucella lapillus]
MLMMRARVQGHRWVDHPAAAVMEARVPGQWVDRPAAVVMEARVAQTQPKQCGSKDTEPMQQPVLVTEGTRH